MIHIQDLSKQFHNSTHTTTVLDNIHLHVATGDIVGIIGLSGAGKSTLLRIIGGLETPTSGTVIVNNHALHKIVSKDKPNFYKEIGTVFQGFNLMMQKTVAKNIALPLEIAGVTKEAIAARVHELLTLVGLEDKHDAYPSQLSGGQKQRVAIARALANNPKLLLCDEPTSALDCITTKSILNLLQHINKTLGVTVVIITHDIEVIKSICHEVVVLHASQVVESGNVSALIESPKHPITQQFLA